MKLALPSLLFLSALSAAPSVVAIPSVAAATAKPDWKCNGWWQDSGLHRYSFLFKGFCEDRWGQCFLDAIRHRGLIAHNWQAWKRPDGWWQVDVSSTAGIGSQVNNAVIGVTKIDNWCKWDW